MSCCPRWPSAGEGSVYGKPLQPREQLHGAFAPCARDARSLARAWGAPGEEILERGRGERWAIQRQVGRFALHDLAKHRDIRSEDGQPGKPCLDKRQAEPLRAGDRDKRARVPVSPRELPVLEVRPPEEASAELRMGADPVGSAVRKPARRADHVPLQIEPASQEPLEEVE